MLDYMSHYLHTDNETIVLVLHHSTTSTSFQAASHDGKRATAIPYRHSSSQTPITQCIALRSPLHIAGIRFAHEQVEILRRSACWLLFTRTYLDCQPVIGSIQVGKDEENRTSSCHLQHITFHATGGFITLTRCSKMFDHFIRSIHHDSNSHTHSHTNKSLEINTIIHPFFLLEFISSSMAFAHFMALLLGVFIAAS
ncbi:hypothetical protein O0I10_011438 [Lichtheimia ornata]|uniref:Uncharacterized protein n=1 Tax=Lichtheimia ornata TaxID=688661 RepID=A0AAD7UUE8_9FUNG|nr:uncharacterized protein O0I10_011438 [Lichtheimia ornata]KAJ8652904.1 hypothetical protein O0I10_011438 [Lichtheimia ornata]